MNKHYFLFVFGGVEPTVHGPYASEIERDNEAKKYWRTEGGDAHAIFRLTCEKYTGRLFTTSFTNSELDDVGLDRQQYWAIRAADADLEQALQQAMEDGGHEDQVEALQATLRDLRAAFPTVLDDQQQTT